MLKSVLIDNYALIDRLEIELSPGFTIITGETGAGKSILLGAIGLLLGKRADTTVLNNPDRKCVVEGNFYIAGYGLEPFFEENELDFHAHTIVRREISNSGKSRAFVNDTPVTLDVLQNLSVFLIDIHSQFQNLSLNDETYLRWIIDSYAGTIEQSENYAEFFKEFRKIQHIYFERREEYQKNVENLDFLNHQFAELLSANLKEDELPLLEQELDQLSHSEEIKTALEAVVSHLQSEDSGILINLKQSLDLISRIKAHYTLAESLEQRIQSTYIELKDIASEADTLNERMDFSPERLTLLTSRIDLLYTLLRKYKCANENELIAIRNELDSKLQIHATGDFELEKLSKEVADREEAVKTAAKELSKARKAAFAQFELKVVSLLRLLGMENGRFTVECNETEISLSGIDRFLFLFSANANVAVQSITKIASGGELSRLMLAIKYLISHSAGLPTIIFDEIDTGVSGDIADKVGNLVKEMSVKMQVLNITHLPQVASKGDFHFLVYKKEDGNTTKTLMRQLDDESRLNEIAKMLSGDKVSEAALENARVLLGR